MSFGSTNLRLLRAPEVSLLGPRPRGPSKDPVGVQLVLGETVGTASDVPFRMPEGASTEGVRHRIAILSSLPSYHLGAACLARRCFLSALVFCWQHVLSIEQCGVPRVIESGKRGTHCLREDRDAFPSLTDNTLVYTLIKPYC